MNEVTEAQAKSKVAAQSAEQVAQQVTIEMKQVALEMKLAQQELKTIGPDDRANRRPQLAVRERPAPA